MVARSLFLRARKLQAAAQERRALGSLQSDFTIGLYNRTLQFLAFTSRRKNRIVRPTMRVHASAQARGAAAAGSHRQQEGGRMPRRGFRLVIAALPALAVRVAALVAVMVAGGFAPVRAEEVYQADPKLVEAAQKEGQVVLYTTLIVDQVVRPMIKAFRSQIS